MEIRPLKLTLTKAETRHLESIYEIETLSYRSPWPFSAFFQDFISRDKILMVAILKDEFGGERVAGFIDFACLPFHEVHILNLAIHPEYRRRGIARVLLSECIGISRRARVEKVWLEVRVSNASAINLYLSAGFEITGVRKGYYSDNQEDAFIMSLHIKEEMG